jgi:predicted RNase H-like nuclease
VTRVLGVDGCPGGWVGALVDDERVAWHRFADMDAAFELGAEVIGVDMPVGLPDHGRRECDLLAKTLLGSAHPRVFLAPPRGVLAAATYEEAGRLHRELADGLGLSLQTWHLVPKIREVDAVADDPRLVEVHPELSLAELGGAGPLVSKKTAAGRAARVTALQTWLPDLGDLPAGDDGLDALAVAWSAQRWLDGRARTLPGHPPYDRHGRPMRIVT